MQEKTNLDRYPGLIDSHGNQLMKGQQQQQQQNVPIRTKTAIYASYRKLITSTKKDDTENKPENNSLFVLEC